ncbi:MAG: EAL domain-containing protein [Mycobacterium sp.]|nr:EAL domain-containing protein [Mycobacterium sp.]MCB1215993.1 EAL domain-containing protein [bacterium]
MGWATGTDLLTRGIPSSPQMPPWTAVLQGMLGLAILILSARLSPMWVIVGRALAVAAGAVAVVFLVLIATNRSSSLDLLWFPDAVRSLPDTWPGRRPSPTASSSILVLAIAAAVMWLERTWVRVFWLVALPAALVMPMVALLAQVFNVVPLKGQAIQSVVSVVLLVAATLLARPDRNPLAWLLKRPDRVTLIWMAGILAGLPILVGISRLVFVAVGASPGTERVLSLAVGTLGVGAAAFYFFQHEQSLLLEKEHRAEVEMRYGILANNVGDVISHLRGKQVVWVSPSVELAFGWPTGQWIGADLFQRIHTDDRDRLAATLDEAASGRSAVGRYRVCTAEGSFRWVEARVGPYLDAEGNVDGALAAVRIIDEQVEAERRVRADRERFEAVVANSPSAISVRDLEHRYSLVNDAFCQLFGQKSVDDVIGQTEEGILPPDVLKRSRLRVVGLLAGESFVEEETVKLGKQDISVMTQRFPLRNPAGVVTELVTMRTDVTHRKNFEREAAERVRWEERIWSAIGDGRLLVYSQPIVDIATREAVAEELLVRLQASDRDVILRPAEFLPECERYGLIPLIDRYMVGRAVDLALTGRKVSVNITGQTIGDPAVMGEILRTLAEAGPDATDKISFEITETIALASLELAKSFSQSVHDLGCRVALDDFGTGYGAFTELRNLNLDALKIDQSFVRDMLEDRDDERVVKTIVFVAQEYGLATVAEGVVSEALLERLTELGVDRAQGFFFDVPKPVEW